MHRFCRQKNLFMLLDIHTHHPVPQPDAICSLRIGKDPVEIIAQNPDQLFSVGIHPWDYTQTELEQALALLEQTASLPNVAAIGETGVDLHKGGPMFRQLQILKHHIDLSEKLGKPLIVHNVKSDDIFCGLRRDMSPTQPWCIHGYRGKPQGALQLTRCGCYISLVEKFNPETLAAIPPERLLAETDEAPTTIQEIIRALSNIKGKDLTDQIKANSLKFCNFA